MIINFPTGLYKNVLPSKPEDRGNVTYTISNDDPPRSGVLFPKIPRGIQIKPRIPKMSAVVLRDAVGSLVFSVSKATKSLTSDNIRQFETGQVLNFDDVEVKEITPMLVNEKTEVRHDVTAINYDKIGVTADEQHKIADLSYSVYQSLIKELNATKRQRADAEEVVSSSQKLINETTRTIDALTVVDSNSVVTDTDISHLIDKLKLKRDAEIIVRDAAVINADTFAGQAEKLVNELRHVATVVK